jgi:hypothetical protein
MMKPNIARTEEARKKARDMFAQVKAKDGEVVKEREKKQAMEIEKTSRLKAIRLAKEAVDRANAPEPKPTKKKPAAVDKAAAKPGKTTGKLIF